MVQHERSAASSRYAAERHVPGTRPSVDERHVLQSDRSERHGDPQLRRKRGDHLLNREESSKATNMVHGLRSDSSPGCGRSLGHGVLHRWRGDMELHRSVDMGERSVQTVQVPTDVQPVPEHVRVGADRCGPIRRRTVSNERIAQWSQVSEVRWPGMGIILRPGESSGKII